MNYDIIGDIHGNADKLEGLLLKLGYAMKNGIYQQEERKAFFVGDFIDRGKQNRRVIEIVRNMIEYGHAHAVMGNHEYNAICYNTPISDTDWLRPHTKSNFKQHENFLKEYPLGHSDTSEVVSWFKTLPLFFECDEFRVIHACWDEKSIEALKKYLNSDNTLKEEYIIESAIKSEDKAVLFHIIERLLKGVEIELPPGCSFADKDGKERHHIRVKWWERRGLSYRQLAFGYDEAATQGFPDDQFPDSSKIPFYEENKNIKPVFFGHYWMTKELKLQKKNICCVDYSAGKNGDLVCYSLSPTNSYPLSEKNFSYFREIKNKSLV